MDKQALGAFLRSRREQVRPADAGLPQGAHRRTPGLRREEVAQLANISVDHYSRLEQARGRNPSRQVLAGIARALRLSDQERAHLFQLADQPDREPGGVPVREVPAGTLALVERLTDAAALVLDGSCHVLAWNPLAAALFEDFSALSDADRNVVRRYFLGLENGEQRYGLAKAEALAVSVASFLRVAAARYPADPGIQAMIRELLAASSDFARLWNAHGLQIDHHGHQEFQHPQVGNLPLDFDIMVLPDEDQRLIILTAQPGSPAAQAMQLLSVIGTQQLTS